MSYPKPITSVDDLPKRYGGLERERFWQQYWEECGVYKFSPLRPDGTPRSREEIFSVDTPPPTVSGALHIGHVYSYAQTDFSVRYQRMRGKHVFYPFGFDDNGLPSERLVERVTGKRAHEVGREEFIKLCKPILEKAEQEFKDLWQSVALSCDWEQFYTTIAPRSRAISQASFIDLYNKGYIYRKEAPTMWCWADQTAIAQAEIEDREVPGRMHDVVFHVADGPGEPVREDIKLIIATTRPELIPACVAVFAHPDDERYKHLFGKVAITPLFEVEVPILPSEKADPEKGTGILMCCTFGDMDDVEHWNMEWPEKLVPRGKLPTRVIIERDGKIDHSEDKSRELIGFSYKLIDHRECLPGHSLVWPTRNQQRAREVAKEMAGMKIKQSRNWIRQKLNEAGLLTGEQEITHTVRHSERGGVPIEILVTPQWYINLLDHKEELIEQGRKVKWHPPYMIKRYEHWVEGLNQDWCISRQRYNGVPFPVWYDVEGNPVLASAEQLPVNPQVDKPVGRAAVPAFLPGGAGGPARDPAAAGRLASDELTIYRRRLPHWRLPGSVYLITWRLRKDQPKLSPKERSIVLEALRWFAGERYHLFAWVVMDDHVHVLVQMIGELLPEEQVRRWKSLTANRLQRECGYQGRVWQDEYFDRIIRDEDEYWEKGQYILSNAAKRWPGEHDYLWAGWSAEGGVKVDFGHGGEMADTAVRPTGEGGHGGPPHQELTPEHDVMDTWATSSLTPLLCTDLRIERDEQGAVKTTERHDQLYPMDMRPQAHDIIRTWA
ncbi:class I tRNA ligase family protein, partial [bacterium]|nr:class I tRNA ligase family protein [bacterium]